VQIIRPIFGLRVSPRVEQLFLLAVALFLVVALPHTPDTLAVLGPVAGGLMGMYLDAQLVLSDNQLVTATIASTNAFDSGGPTFDLPVGEPLGVMFTQDAAAKLSAGNETYQFQVIQSANPDLSVPDILLQTDTGLVGRALLVKGFRFYLPLPSQLKTKQYLGVRYVLGGTAPSMLVSADLRPMSFLQNEKVYAANFTITS